MSRSLDAGDSGASRPSIGSRLLIMLALLITVLAVTLLVAAAKSMEDTLVRAASARASEAARQVASLLAQSSRRGRDNIAEGARHEAFRNHVAGPSPETEAALAPVLERLAAAGPRRFSVWSPDGDLISAHAAGGPTESGLSVDDLPPTPALPPSELGLLQASGDIVFSDVAVPIPAETGDSGEAPPLGFLVVRTPASLNPPDLLTRMIGGDAVIRAGSPAGGAWTDFMRPVRPPPLEPGDAPVVHLDDRRERYVAATAEVEGTPWTVWVGLPHALVVAPAVGFLWRMGAVTACIAALALLLAHVMARRVVARPLAALTHAAQDIATGDHARRVTPHGTAEIGGLGDAFNRMAERVQADIAARQAAEEALRDGMAQFRVLFEANPLPMWVYDPETLAFIEVNDAATRHYGWSREEFLAMRITDIRPPEDVEKLLASLATPREAWTHSEGWRHRRRSGEIIDVEITSHALSFRHRDAVLVVAQDVTRRKQLEAQLLQARKMEAIGTLAGGIAHDFNNLLTVIIGYVDMLKAARDMPPDHRADLGHVEGAAARARDLTRQLLAFARRQVLQPRVLEINRAVNDAAGLLRKLVPESIVLAMPPPTPLASVRMDPTQLHQVLMNLTANAAHAMPRGGRLTIETSVVQIDEEYRARRGPITPGPHVLVAVSDTGHGMDEATLAHVFEPFFTTKEAGQGTGLGLATVHGIVKQSGGDIWVYSEPGRGTTFKIYLPVASEQAANEARPLPPATADPEGSETILLVEDDDAVRSLVRQSLERRGYLVIEASSPREAMRIASEPGASFDLLLSDVVMPEAVGPELHAKLERSRPGLRVLYMSGYADAAIVTQGILEEGMPFIQKPFTPQALATRVRQVLDSGR